MVVTRPIGQTGKVKRPIDRLTEARYGALDPMTIQENTDSGQTCLQGLIDIGQQIGDCLQTD